MKKFITLCAAALLCMAAFAQQQANLLTVNSITPTNGCAVVTIAAETSNVTASLDEMLVTFQQMTGVIKAEVLAAG